MVQIIIMKEIRTQLEDNMATTIITIQLLKEIVIKIIHKAISIQRRMNQHIMKKKVIQIHFTSLLHQTIIRILQFNNLIMPYNNKNLKFRAVVVIVIKIKEIKVLIIVLTKVNKQVIQDHV
jgi:hypothetical protein